MLDHSSTWTMWITAVVTALWLNYWSIACHHCITLHSSLDSTAQRTEPATCRINIIFTIQTFLQFWSFFFQSSRKDQIVPSSVVKKFEHSLRSLSNSFSTRVPAKSQAMRYGEWWEDYVIWTEDVSRNYTILSSSQSRALHELRKRDNIDKVSNTFQAVIRKQTDTE